MDRDAARDDERDAAPVTALLLAYYRALETGAPLAPFYATDAAAGGLGPVVKFGSGKDEAFRGSAAVAAEVTRVGATLSANRLESRALTARRRGDVGWFSDLVWWSGVEGAADDRRRLAGQGGQEAPFASLTRWSGVCLRLPEGWKLLQMHVSEEV
jgi:hypothetical protein